MAWYSGISKFLSSPAVQGAANLATAGYGIYSGMQQQRQAARAQEDAMSLARQQAAYTQKQAERLAKLSEPLERAQAKYALEDIQALRPLRVAQRQYGAERGLSDIERARAIDPMLDVTEQRLLGTLSEGEEALAQRLREQATADVAQSFGRTRAQEQRRLASMGVDPRSGGLADYGLRMAQAQALGEAGARTQATRQAEATALGRQAQALGYRAGIPLPQQQYTPTTTPGGIASQLASAAGTSADLYSSAAREAERDIRGAQYQFQQGLKNLGRA